MIIVLVSWLTLFTFWLRANPREVLTKWLKQTPGTVSFAENLQLYKYFIAAIQTVMLIAIIMTGYYHQDGFADTFMFYVVYGFYILILNDIFKIDYTK